MESQGESLEARLARAEAGLRLFERAASSLVDVLGDEAALPPLERSLLSEATAIDGQLRERMGALVRLAVEAAQKIREERAAHAHSQSLLEAAPDAIILVDDAGRIVLVNGRAERLFGYGREELLGKTVETLVPKRLRSAHAAHRGAYSSAPRVRGMGSGLELYGLCKNGREFPIEVSLSPIRTEQGLLVSSAIRDLSERKRFQARLRSSEEMLRLLVENVRDHELILLDPDGRVASWNAAAHRLKGYAESEIIGQHFSCFLPPEDQLSGKAERALEIALAEGRWQDEGPRVRKDGSLFWADVVVSPVYDDQGEKLLGFAKVTRDITERKKAEEKFHGFMEAAPDAVIIANQQGIIEAVNAQTERLFGYERSELMGRPVELLMPARFRERHPMHRAMYAQNPKTRAMGAGGELYGLKKDGREFPVEISLSVLKTAEEILVVSAVRDISARKQIETALTVANQELEAFCYSVAHDLRAPLRGMNGFARMLSERHAARLDAQGVDWLQEIISNARKMGHLIDALLSLSRISRSELRPEEVDLALLSRQIFEELRHAEPERDVTLIAPSELTAEMDPALARVLMSNLLSNAWKYTQKRVGAQIEVGSGERDGRRCYFVRDNGTGFDMRYADKLFAPFQRLHSASEYPGTGIGLATVQRIVHRHGGECWAEGAVEQGATFGFELGPWIPEEKP